MSDLFKRMGLALFFIFIFIVVVVIAAKVEAGVLLPLYK